MEKSLKKLQLDYVDLFVIHMPNLWRSAFDFPCYAQYCYFISTNYLNQFRISGFLPGEVNLSEVLELANDHNSAL